MLTLDSEGINIGACKGFLSANSKIVSYTELTPSIPLPLPPSLPPSLRLLAPTVVETSIVGRDGPKTGLSPVLPRRGQSPRQPSPNKQPKPQTEKEVSKQRCAAVRTHQLVSRTQSEVVQRKAANGSHDVFGAEPFTTSNIPANQMRWRSDDEDFDPRAPPSPPPERRGNPPLADISSNFPPPPPGFAD